MRTPLTALFQVIESQPHPDFNIPANGPWATVYRTQLSAEDGDQLRIRAQVEITNPHDEAVNNIHGILRIAVNGQEIEEATSPTQNAVPGLGGGNHMPMWADATYKVSKETAGPTTVEAQYRAEFYAGDLDVYIHALEYGHLVVEHYRTYPSRSAAIKAGARFLHASQVALNELKKCFPGSVPAEDPRGAIVYAVSLEVKEGDIVRLEGQSTSQRRKRPDNEIEMHGSGIFLDRQPSRPLSPWSTEDTPAPIPYVPLSTDAVHRPDKAESANYSVSMHGVWRHGDDICLGGGYLYALVFREAIDGLSLLYMKSKKMTEAKQIVANSGDSRIVEVELPETGSSRHLIRVSGFVEITPPSHYPGGISCTMWLVTSSKGVTVKSPFSTKYATGWLGNLPLRVEQLMEEAPNGPGTVALHLLCEREGENPILSVGERALFVEIFGSP